jgi:serine/threonine protein kinase
VSIGVERWGRWVVSCVGTKRIGPYEVLRKVGSGAMGSVHLALDAEGRAVAVKVLHPHVAEDRDGLRRLAREAAAMLRVRSPYVAELLDLELSGPEPYLVTRYVPGRSLHDIVKERGPLKGEALRGMGSGLAAALDAIHEAGVVHRDLTPRNVVVADGLPVLVDFGISRVLDATRMTQGFIGTAGYVAPEVLHGREAGPAADVFAWGTTMVFAATGSACFGGKTMLEILTRTLQEEPDLTGVPVEWRPFLRRSLRKDPEERMTSASLIGAILSLVPRNPGGRTARSGEASFGALPHSAQSRISDLWVAAGQARETGHLGRAEELYGEVRRLAQKVGDRHSEMFALYQLGAAAEARGEYRTANAHYSDAEVVAALLSSPSIQALVLRGLERMARKQGDPALAGQFAERARLALDAKHGPAPQGRVQKRGSGR